MRSSAIIFGLLAAIALFSHSKPADAAKHPVACAPAWDANTTYSEAGTAVSEYGVNYSNKWWSMGSDPLYHNTQTDPANGMWQETAICHACEIAPSPPTNITPIATSDIQTDLIWDPSIVPANCTVTAYHVFRNGKEIGVSTGNNFAVSKLKAAKRYTFTVKAEDSAGISDASDSSAVKTAAAGQNRGPTPVFAPYIDMNQAVSEGLPKIMTKAGLNMVTMAFLISPCPTPSNCTGVDPCGAEWGGTVPYNNDVLADGSTITALVKKVRKNGGDVIVSFGGSAGVDVALTCKTVNKLTRIYQNVIDHYKATSIDFDIEGSTSSDQASIERRAQALVKIRKANPNLTISYTLAVLPNGLDATGLNVLTSSKANKFEPDVVNIMAMDYGPNADNNGQMGMDAIFAANATALQIDHNDMTARVGVTPMIGVNDVNTEIFQAADADKVLAFAKNNPDIARLAMWSLNRDNGNCPTNKNADATCSGLAQRAYGFAKQFNAFGAQ